MSVVVIGNSIAAGLRLYPIVWKTFFYRYKAINQIIERGRTENVLWRLNDTTLPKTVRSVVMRCINISDEISLVLRLFSTSICNCHPYIQVIFSGILSRDIHWSTRRVKIKKSNSYLKDYLQHIHQNNFHAPRTRLDFTRQLIKHATML